MSDIIETDLAVIGAGISGIAAGYYLQKNNPKLSFSIYEARKLVGGTWDIFRYPGIRSDTDMYTLGFPFNPWPHKNSIAQGDQIRDYIQETAEKFGIDKKIKFGHKLKRASWSSEEKKWTLDIAVTSSEGSHDIKVKAPFKAAKHSKGPILQPQFWPKDIDYTDKRVAVIGSGATTISMVPALAKKASKVTMVQRSPSYVYVVPESETWPQLLKKYLPLTIFNSYIRFTHMFQYNLMFILCRIMPQYSRQYLRYKVARSLPNDVPLDPHFNPRYMPWDERLCLIPDNGEFFGDIKAGKLEIVTGNIEKIVPEGIMMKETKQVIPLDMIVQATGLNFRLLGGVDLTVDGKKVVISERFQYRGMMLDGVPNFALCFGYVHNSFTLGANLVSQYMSRLLLEME